MLRPITLLYKGALAALAFVTLPNCIAATAQSNESQNSPGPSSVETLAAPSLTKTNFMTRLSEPWDLAFLKDGTMFFTEKCRGLSVRLPNGQVNRLFGVRNYAVSAPDLFCEGQSGVNGVAIDPDFANNRFIYVYMASSLSANPRTNRVVRLVVADNFTSVQNRTDIITDIPYKNRPNAVGSAGAHSGGRLRFGPDGYLYVTTGDNHNSALPHGLTNLGAKVLRVTREGAAAPGNNAPAGADARIFTYGHRNVQGLSFHPTTGQAFVGEHGPGHTDEVTALVAGKNAGWDPRPEPGVECPDNYCGYTTNKLDGTLTPMTDLGKFPDAMVPTWTTGNDSQGMGPVEFLRGSKWKSWDGRLAASLMATQKLEVLAFNADGSVKSTTRAPIPAARMRSVVLGPDANLYIATDSGAIWKIVPR